MIVLIQRVRSASVDVEDKTVGSISQGILAFVGFQPQDTPPGVSNMLERVLNYRIFADNNDKMNLSLRDIEGGLLLVPQFTLAADTERGRRPSFTKAAEPELGRSLFDHLIAQAKSTYQIIETGVFGADMQVTLQNDGPVTFILK